MQDYWKLDIETVLMILENYQELSTGAKPESPDGYENPETKRTGSGCHAPFEGSCLLCAEVSRRVKRCGLDGLIVCLRYGLIGWSKPKTPENIAEEWLIPLDDIYRKTNKVAYYCCGRRCRKESYEDWKHQKHYRKVALKCP